MNDKSYAGNHQQHQQSQYNSQQQCHSAMAFCLAGQPVAPPPPSPPSSPSSSQIRQASVRLAHGYMRRVIAEIDSIATSAENEPLREFLLLQGVRFAFRVHQVSPLFAWNGMECNNMGLLDGMDWT